MQTFKEIFLMKKVLSAVLMIMCLMSTAFAYELPHAFWAMNDRYTNALNSGDLQGIIDNGKQIVDLILKMRNKIPSLSIRTSLIVGFPGETDEDFDILKNFLVTYQLEKVGVFTYSREENTPAYNFENQVDEDVAKDRRDILMTVQKDVSADIISRKIGSLEQVIIEGYDEEEFCYVGRSSADTPEVDGVAYVYSERELGAGDIVRCTVIDSDEYDIVCKLEN